MSRHSQPSNEGARDSTAGEEARSSSDMLLLAYDELRKLAAYRMAQEPAGQTLQPTALVHEAFLRLETDGALHWENKRHFFSAAAEAMRRILVERARSQGRVKRGGGRLRVSLSAVDLPARQEDAIDVLALDGVLQRLQHKDPRKHDVVMLRYFAGLSIEETATALNISLATANRDWSFARAWLHSEMAHDGGSDAPLDVQ